MTSGKPLGGTKFMIVLNPNIEKELRRAAKKNGIHLQELLRARVIPDWLYGPPIVSNRVIEKLVKKGLLNPSEAKNPE
jgi:hypothetical protein